MTGREIYVSVDIEADGPYPGDHSMLSLGAAAIDGDTIIDTFTVNLDCLPSSWMHPDTKIFWSQNQVAYDLSRIDCVQPTIGMVRFVKWLKKLPGTPVFVGYPAVFDWMFTSWYLHKFAGENPFSYAGLDMHSYAMATLKNKNFWGMGKSKMPTEWFSHKNPQIHIALNDAIEQAVTFIAMKNQNEAQLPK